MAGQLRAAIRRAERTLSAQQKVIFRLRHYEEMSCEEIAAHVAVAPFLVEESGVFQRLRVELRDRVQPRPALVERGDPRACVVRVHAVRLVDLDAQAASDDARRRTAPSPVQNVSAGPALRWCTWWWRRLRKFETMPGAAGRSS